MRVSLAFLVLAGAAPLAAQQDTSLNFLHPVKVASGAAQNVYREQTYRPLRLGEVRSAGFLTEGHALPFGRVLGPVTPEPVHSSQSPGIAMSGTMIAVRPPEGASYNRGDTILLAIVVPARVGWGEVVIPTGLARVGDHDPRQTLATVLETYGPIRDGQSALPMESISDPGHVIPVKATGPTGTVIMPREDHVLAQDGSILFIDMGRAVGMRPGDFVELRSRPGPRVNAADTIDELMAVGQVVHVSEKSSTIKLTRIISPVIPPGTPVVRIATLPN